MIKHILCVRVPARLWVSCWSDIATSCCGSGRRCEIRNQSRVSLCEELLGDGLLGIWCPSSLMPSVMQQEEGMMTSPCGRAAPLHVHLWVPRQHVSRAGGGEDCGSLCCWEEREAGYQADAASCFAPPLSFSSSLPPAAVGEAPSSSHLPLPRLHVHSSSNQSARWGQGVAKPPFQCGAAASPQS